MPVAINFHSQLQFVHTCTVHDQVKEIPQVCLIQNFRGESMHVD